MITLWIPAFDEAEARTVARAVNAGQIGHIEHYLSEEAAGRVRDHLNRLCAKPRQVFKVELRPADDGTLINVWPVDRVGDAAAALLLFVVAPVLAARFWWILA